MVVVLFPLQAHLQAASWIVQAGAERLVHTCWNLGILCVAVWRIAFAQLKPVGGASWPAPFPLLTMTARSGGVVFGGKHQCLLANNLFDKSVIAPPATITVFRT